MKNVLQDNHNHTPECLVYDVILRVEKKMVSFSLRICKNNFRYTEIQNKSMINTKDL